MKRLRQITGPALILAAFAVVTVLGPSCSDGPQIIGSNDGGLGGVKTKKQKNVGDDDSLSGNGELSAESGALSDSDTVSRNLGAANDAASGAPGDVPAADKPVVYPGFDFNGKGACTCKGKVNTTTARIATSLTKDVLQINMYQADIQLSGKGKGQDQATKKIQENTGITEYTRPTSEDVKALKAANFNLANYAIFAKSVVKQRQGQNYIFDKPIPVFPWPGLASRYAALQAAGGSASWTANVTGFRSFQVTVTMTLLSADDQKIVVKFTTDIPSDQTWEVYEDFPLARESTYTINPQASLVTRIDNVNYFFGNECGNNKEQIKMAYLVCKRDSDGKVDEFPCTQ